MNFDEMTDEDYRRWKISWLIVTLIGLIIGIVFLVLTFTTAVEVYYTSPFTGEKMFSHSDYNIYKEAYETETTLDIIGGVIDILSHK